MVQEAFLEASMEFVRIGLSGALPCECAQGLLAANLIPFKKPRDSLGVKLGKLTDRQSGSSTLTQDPWISVPSSMWRWSPRQRE